MAFKEVTMTEEEMKGSGKRFEKFDAIGDTHIGALVRIRSETKTFKVEEGPKTFNAYEFYGPKRTDPKAAPEFEISPLPYDLERKMKKAMRPVSEGGFGLEPGKGHIVKMTWASNQDTGQSSPMKVFKVEVDTDYKPQKPFPPEVTWAKKPDTAKPPPIAEDDIPF